MDLTAVGIKEEGPHITYHTGLAIEIPKGYVGLLFPRSSIYKTSQALTNSVGVIDSGYRGEIMMKFTRGINHYCIGDRIGQIMILPYPQIEFEEVEKLSETNRGSGGFGSTGE
jgi:dUTP pyrophosphatase